jgi:thymidylate kinase
MTLYVAIEGPSLSGKSTVIRSTTTQLNLKGVRTIALPCYADICTEIGRNSSEVSPRTADDQILTFAEHIGLEIIRRARITKDAQIVLLDRSLWTCLAHTWALGVTGKVDARKTLSDAKIGDLVEPLLPANIIYFDLSKNSRIARRPTRNNLPELLLADEFVNAFRDYFEIPDLKRIVKWISDDCTVSQKVQQTVQLIESMLESSHGELEPTN